MNEKVNLSVYVIKSAGGICKIGISFDPESRLRSLLTGHGLDLELVHVETVNAESARLIERAAHRMLEKTRSAGEWFKVPVEKAIQAIQIAAWIVDDCRKDVVVPVETLIEKRRLPIRFSGPIKPNNYRQPIGGVGPTGEIADLIEKAWKTLPEGRIPFSSVMKAVAKAGGINIDMRTVSAWLRVNSVTRLSERNKVNGRRQTWLFKQGKLKLVNAE